MTTVASDRRGAIRLELESASADFHQMLEGVRDSDLNSPSANPRWTNGQIIWHIAFAFMLTRALLPIAELFDKLPRKLSKWFAAVLNWSTPAFNVVNRLGPVGGARIHSRESVGRTFDWALSWLLRRLGSMDEERLSRGMHYPRRWDPVSFQDYMTMEAIFRYPVAHMRHHLTQVRAASSRPD